MSATEDTIYPQPCVGCGQDTLSIVEIARDGDLIAAEFMCRSCQGSAFVEAASFRRQFEELISTGVSRAAANEYMCDVVDRHFDPTNRSGVS